MVEKSTPSRVVFNGFNYAYMILVCIICLAPLWHVFVSSLSNPRELMMTSGLLFWPVGEATLDGYRIVLSNPTIFMGYMNTLIYVTTTTLLGTTLTLIAGFCISRKTRYQKFMTIFILFTMLFSGGLIPSFIVNLSLGLINNRMAIILPGVINAFFIILIKSAFEQLSPSYEESAKLDGASPLKTMLWILIPLIKANIAVIVVFTVVLQWNSWFPASIYLQRRRDLWPLQLFMREILVQHDIARIVTAADARAAVDLGGSLVRYAVTIVGTLPILLVYPFAQKYFVKGVLLGGVKG